MNGKIKAAFAVIIMLATVCIVAVPAVSTEAVDQNTGAVDTIAVEVGYAEPYTSGSIEFSKFRVQVIDPDTGKGPAGIAVKIKNSAGIICSRPYANGVAGDMIFLDVVQPIGMIGNTFYLNVIPTDGADKGKVMQRIEITVVPDTVALAVPNVTYVSGADAPSIFADDTTKAGYVGINASPDLRSGMSVDRMTGKLTFTGEKTPGTYAVWFLITVGGVGHWNKVMLTICGHNAPLFAASPVTELTLDAAGTASSRFSPVSHDGVTYTVKGDASVSCDTEGNVTFSAAGTHTFTLYAGHCGIQTPAEFTVTVSAHPAHGELFADIVGPLKAGESRKVTTADGTEYGMTATLNGESVTMMLNEDGTVVFDKVGTYVISVTAKYVGCGDTATHEYTVVVIAEEIPPVPPVPDNPAVEDPIGGQQPPQNGCIITAL